jgi:hypothetical protein
MKWESVVAGLAALGGLVLITKTPSVERNAETIVFNARAPPKKQRITEVKKLIKTPILKQIMDYDGEPIFSFKQFDYRSKNNKLIEITAYQDSNEYIMIDYENGPLCYQMNGRLGSENWRKGQNGFKNTNYMKPWNKPFQSNRFSLLITIIPILKHLEKHGYPKQGIESVLSAVSSYHSEKQNLKLYEMITEYPERDWTIQDIETVFPNQNMNAPKNLVDLWKNCLIDNNPPNEIWPYVSERNVRESVGALGRILLNGIDSESQFEWETECRYKIELASIDIGNGFTNNTNEKGFRKMNAFKLNRQKLINMGIEITDNDYLLMIKLWIIAQNLYMHEAYELWTKQWEEKYNFNNSITDTNDRPMLVKNIRGNLDLYRNRSEVPDRIKWSQMVIGSQQLPYTTYPKSILIKKYMKMRNELTNRQQYFKELFQNYINKNRIDANSESKQRLMDAINQTPPFSNYDKLINRNINTAISIDKYDWRVRINDKIRDDIRLSKEELTPQEKADIFQAYQVRISRGKDEYTLQEKNKLDEAIQKLNEKSAKESERVYADTARASNKIKEILGI